MIPNPGELVVVAGYLEGLPVCSVGQHSQHFHPWEGGLTADTLPAQDLAVSFVAAILEMPNINTEPLGSHGRVYSHLFFSSFAVQMAIQREAFRSNLCEFL